MKYDDLTKEELQMALLVAEACIGKLEVISRELDTSEFLRCRRAITTYWRKYDCASSAYIPEISDVVMWDDGYDRRIGVVVE